jgi:hypothetical protein
VERVTFIGFRGRSILIEDFSGLRPGDEFRAALDDAAAVIRSQPPGSVLALMDATHSTFNAEAIGMLKAFTEENAPFVRAAAVVGVAGLLGVAMLAVARFSGRTVGRFPDRPSALDWLIAQ